MSSSARSILRQIRRHAANTALINKRIGCPKCGKPISRKGLIGKKVFCLKCGWEGRLR